MDDPEDVSKLEEMADFRLKLEECRHRRAEIAIELEKRRTAAEFAQKQLAVMRQAQALAAQAEQGARGGARFHEGDTLAPPEDPELLKKVDRNEYRLIEEHLNQRHEARQEQAMMMSEKLRQLNEERWKLQQKQQRLVQQRKEEARRVKEEAARFQVEMADAEVEMHMEGRSKAETNTLLGVDWEDRLLADEEQIKQQPFDLALGGESVGLSVAKLDETVQKIGVSIINQRDFVDELRNENEEAEEEAGRPLWEPPPINPKMRPEDLVEQEAIDKHVQVWADRGDEINKRLTDEAFQKAIRLAMKQYLFEVVDLMSADIAAEAAFVRFWAERTSASMIMQAISKHKETAAKEAKMSEEQKSDHSRTLRGILREFQVQRFQEQFMHVHSLPTINAAQRSQYEDDPKKKKKDKDELPEELEAKRIGLWSDLVSPPPDRNPVEELKERAAWEDMDVVPVFFNAEHHVVLAEPSPNANLLALACAGQKGLTVFDIKHLPPLQIRKADHACAIVHAAWSYDCTQIACIDAHGGIVVFSLRLDAIRKDGVVTNGGELHVLGLQTVDTFKSLVDVRSGEVNFAEVKQLLDTSDKGSFLPTAVAFHPSLTMLGKHPSLLVGTQGGSIAKMNNHLLRTAVVYPCCAPNTGGAKLAVTPQDPDLPAREYYVRHLSRVVMIAAIQGGSRQVSMDSRGLVAVWHYSADKFSTLGWFRPEAVSLVDIADANLEHDPAVEPETKFPANEEQKAARDKGGKTWERLAAAYMEELQPEANWGEPIETETWTTGLIRKKQGKIESYEVEDPDVEAARSTIHTLKLDHTGVLLSHVESQRVRTIFKGSVVKAKVDHTGNFIVVLGYLPPTRVHGARITLFRFHIPTESLHAPKIELPVPDKYKKEIQSNPLEPPVHLDADFDVAPPQGDSTLQTVHLLLGNHVYTYGLESGRELIPRIDPLKQQRRKANLDRLRVCSKYKHPIYEYSKPRTPPPPPPKGHPPPPMPPPDAAIRKCFEHLIIVTARDSPIVYMFSMELDDGDNASHRVAPGQDIYQGIEAFTPPETPASVLSSGASSNPSQTPPRTSFRVAVTAAPTEAGVSGWRRTGKWLSTGKRGSEAAARGAKRGKRDRDVDSRQGHLQVEA